MDGQDLGTGNQPLEGAGNNGASTTEAGTTGTSIIGAFGKAKTGEGGEKNALTDSTAKNAPTSAQGNAAEKEQAELKAWGAQL